MPLEMGNEKKNGKLVVIGVLGFVLLLSGIAFLAQQMINANRGKPPRTPPEQVEDVGG